jgi:hypothetical protein
MTKRMLAMGILHLTFGQIDGGMNMDYKTWKRGYDHACVNERQLNDDAYRRWHAQWPTWRELYLEHLLRLTKAWLWIRSWIR